MTLTQARALASLRGLGLAAAFAAVACGTDGPTSSLRSIDGLAFSVLSPSTTFPGDRVRTTGTANIRSGPAVSTTLLGTQPMGAAGTVLSGPITDVNGDKLVRWQINFDNGVDGWAAAAYLDQTSSGAPVGAVTIAAAPSGIVIGQTVQLAATVTDTAGAVLAGQPVTWASSNSAIATVSAAGQVKGVAAGKVTITASSRGKLATAPMVAGKFVIGGRVSALTANIRSGPSGAATMVGTQPTGALGVVTGGPVVDSTGDKLRRWQVDFDAGVDGWAAEAYLAASAAPVPVALVIASPDSARLMPGQTVQLAAVAKDATGATLPNTPMAFLSLDTTRAKVAATGMVTAVAVGTVFVVVSSGNKADTTAITVVPVPVAAVAVTPGSAALIVADSAQFSGVAQDSTGATLAGHSISWTTSDAQVASVTAAGLVRGLAAGTASITASSGGKSAAAAVTVSAPVRGGYYVSASGSATNDGSIGRPWNLATALSGAGGRIGAGDTVWLRGGTYRGAFRSTLAGAAGNPVVVRQYPRERAIIDGAGTSSSVSVFYVGGQYSEFWDFEITNSDPIRTTTSTANNVRPNVVSNYASHTRYVNLAIHDGGVAFYTEPLYQDVEITGCVIFNNGWQGPDRGHGHGLYLKSYTGPVVARDNIIFNQFGYGVHAYTNAGSGELNNIRLEGNVAFNNGALSTIGTSSNILLGGDGRATGDVLASNFTWFSPGVAGSNVKVGYGTLQNGDVQLQDNYFAGGSPVLELGYWTTATLTANTFIGSATIVTLNDQITAGHVWNGNAHQRDLLAPAWRFNGAAYGFAAWQGIASLGSADVALPGVPTVTRTVIRPSPRDAGRGNVIVYNWGHQGSVGVDLSGILHAGDRFEVHNAQDLFGAPVASGSYSGPVSLSLGGVTAPAPVGMATSRAPKTGPDFDVFVVTRI